MSDSHSGRITIAECEICSALQDVETSFSKWGWDELARPLPIAASRLAPVEDTTTYDKERHHVRRCPICGTFYQYDQSYEYLVNGSEDEEVLTRLTPSQVRRFLSEREYEDLCAWMAHCMTATELSVRRYAAQSLVAHHLERGEPDQVTPYLQLDADVVDGVLLFLVRESDDLERLRRLLPLQPALEELARAAGSEVAGRASYLLKLVQRFADDAAQRR